MSFSCDHSMDGSFPPSPAEDRGSKRLSWSNLLQRLTKLKGVNEKLTADQRNRSTTGSVADISMSDSESSVFIHPLEETLAAEVVEIIAQSLSDTSLIALSCSKLILPDCLLHNIGQELLHLAASEPCGLRGAIIDLCVDMGDRENLQSVDEIAVDGSLVPTFHVTLILRPEAGGLWPRVQKLFKGNTQSHSTISRHQHTLRLGTGFRVIKRKLYCTGELLIEEC
ncbi:DNA damage-inducible transcript 4 protein-like [Lampris incognitus]|uniref:DNA damage-inducible transcript 4 protein-like n=1 Tax=Lampris incognitus TaxID=2546036 RepID=UPI0024B606EF|nr:DNA damage-inducible transcript 4 protein-like [Lampris incognitus]